MLNHLFSVPKTWLEIAEVWLATATSVQSNSLTTWRSAQITLISECGGTLQSCTHAAHEPTYQFVALICPFIHFETYLQ